MLHLSVAAIFAQQAPQALSYQAVARTVDGLIIPTQNIGVRFSILDGNVNGTVVYQETHSTVTNNFGLFSLSVGKGTVVSSTFNTIDWGAADKFLKVEIAPDGTTNYQVQGTTQLLSIPYALYAEKTKLVAGCRIAVNGNVISNSLWTPDANGIHSISNNVGIGSNSALNTALTLTQAATGGNSAAADITGSDTWQTVVRFRNLTSNREYQFNLAGSGNTAMPIGSLGLFNARVPLANSRWVWNTDGTNNAYLAIGSNTFMAQSPKSRLHVFNGDVNIDQIGSGIIMKSPNGQCWRVTIDNSGNLVRTAITCPN